MTLQRETASWRIDLTVWLHDPHTNVTAWHEALRDRIIGATRSGYELSEVGRTTSPVMARSR